MNKKLLTFALVGIFLMSVVAAISYFGSFEQDVSIEAPVVVNEVETTAFGGYAGGMYAGAEFPIENVAPFEVEVEITNDAPEGISVNYLTGLTMFTKDAEWNETTDLTATLWYTKIGNDFIYKVDTESNLTGYVVVYYPDLDGNPGSWNIANAQLVGDVTSTLTKVDIDPIPFESDFNDAGKLWLIPSADWDSKAWNPTVWLFEHELITTNVASVTIPGDTIQDFLPVYVIDNGYVGEDTITTTIA